MINYLDKIKQLSKINVTMICKELHIDRANLLNGRTTPENEKRVYDKMVEEYKKIIKEL